MALIKNITGLHAAIAAVAPVDGVSGDGTIWFSKEATPDQISAGHAALAAFVDVAPQIAPIALILGAMTDPEYSALMTFANTHPQLHRAIHAARRIDLSLPAVQTLIQALVTAGVITSQRAAVVFVAPPPPPTPPMTAHSPG